MAMLLHEIWEEPAEGGGWLTGVCLAGPDGAGFRRLLAPGTRLKQSFKAGSHFEAMTIYYRLEGRRTYTTIHASDHAPYPDEWAQRQHA
jgi:hypothetical protein